MSAGLGGIERLGPTRHDRTGFDCGNELRNGWLTRYAGQSERRDARPYLRRDRPGHAVFGYYTLVAGQLWRDDATTAVSQGEPPYFPIWGRPVSPAARAQLKRADLPSCSRWPIGW